MDADNRIIVAHGLTADGSDRKQLAPMVEDIGESASRLPKELSTDVGRCSEANLELLKTRASAAMPPPAARGTARWA